MLADALRPRKKSRASSQRGDKLEETPEQVVVPPERKAADNTDKKATDDKEPLEERPSHLPKEAHIIYHILQDTLGWPMSRVENWKL